MLTLGLHADPVLAGPLEGEKEVFLQEANGTRHKIGVVQFKPDSAGGVTYALTLKAPLLSDHFLSMRPFKCLEGPSKHWCHVPYPYEIQRHLRPGDLTDLEYDLLFLWKGATDYGINMWNGVYYRLEPSGAGLRGSLTEMDMGLLAVPPEAGDLRPIHPDHLHEADPDSHWLPELVIE